jgi:glycosyltransferase involved in cell wall biosynthesis
MRPIPISFFKMYLMFTYRVIELFSDRLIVHGYVFRRILDEEYGVDKGRIEVIPHGIDCDPPMNSSRVDYWKGKLKHQKTVLCFGVLSAKKGLDNLIKAYGLVAKKDPEYMLIMAGEESSYYPGYGSKIRSLVEREGLRGRVMFTGFVSSEDAYALFSLAEVIVIPHAVSFSASGSLSLAECFGKPIIAAATPYFAETLGNGKEALLVSPNNRRLFAQTLATLFEDRELRDRLSENMRLKSRELSWSRVAESTIELYRSMCKCA